MGFVVYCEDSTISDMISAADIPYDVYFYLTTQVSFSLGLFSRHSGRRGRR